MSDHQLSMFEQSVTQYESRVDVMRTTDPETSYQAGKSCDVARCENIFLRTLRLLKEATAYEIADYQGEWPDDESIRKRAGRLKQDGLIEVIGTKKGENGRSRELFRITDKGRRAIDGR